MYKVYDISMAIYEGMPVYKNKPEKQPKIHVVQDFPKGSARESRIDIDVHTGTHVDSPLHMIPGGGTMQTLPLENFVGKCRVLELSHVNDKITKEDLFQQNIQQDEFIILKTRNSTTDSFDPEFVYLAEDGAKYLAEIPIKGVGIDALGIERSQPEHMTHKYLFEANILIIEGLRLKNIEAATYFLVAAPIKLLETEASPARVLLIDGIL